MKRKKYGYAILVIFLILCIIILAVKHEHKMLSDRMAIQEEESSEEVATPEKEFSKVVATQEEEIQCSDTAQKGSNSEKYLELIRRANKSSLSEINGAWFVEDSDRFAYCETYCLTHDGRCSVTGRIQLAEMKGTDALAQAVNRYHEEMYENHKARMQGYREAALETEDFAARTDGTRYCDNIYTMASFRWGNVFTVLDIEETPDGGSTAVLANFNSMTGEKYEAADLFNTTDYAEKLTDIVRQGNSELGADEWNRILHSRFSFAVTYRGLLLYGDGPEKILWFAWEDVEDILALELMADVVRYSEWNNPYCGETETWTGGHLYPIFEANQGADAMEWRKSSGYNYIKADGEKEEKWFVDHSDRFSYYAECELERPYEGYGAGVWEIQLAEMKGTDALAQAVNRYHEELYESRKAQMQEFQEEAAAMTAEEVLDNSWKIHVNLFTMAAFRWGNLFTVVDMDYVGYKACRIELSASFNMKTGEKYELDDLFQGENYREELLEIIRKEDYTDECLWIFGPSGLDRFTYLISYHGLLLGDIFDAKYVLVKWEDLRDILSPEFVSDVLVYTDWNNPRVTIGTTDIWDEAPEEITVRLSNGESYEITKETFVIDHDQFLPEYSVVDYPNIKFSDEAINDKLGEKINRIFYETAMLNYDEELGQKINAEYACYYSIANADEDYISIFYESTTGAGGGVDNRRYAVTVSLADGNEVSLADFMDMDEIGHRLADYRGTVYMECGYSIDLWLDNKEEFIEEWLGDERSPVHGWYLYEGRIGFLFLYYQGSNANIFMEFSGIIN